MLKARSTLILWATLISQVMILSTESGKKKREDKRPK